MIKNTVETFWSLVEQRGPDECWPFTGHTHKGYGRFKLDGKTWRAHRLAFFLTHGRIEDDVLHTCDNKPCCNLRHLYDGSHQQNMRDASERNRFGHRTGSQNPAAVLDEERVQQIRLALAAGVSQRALAREHGVSQSAISQIARNVRWRKT